MLIRKRFGGMLPDNGFLIARVCPIFCTSVFTKYQVSLSRVVLLLAIALLSSCISAGPEIATPPERDAPQESIPPPMPEPDEPELLPPASRMPDTLPGSQTLPDPERPAPDAVEIAIDRLLAVLTLEEKAAQLCMPALARRGPALVEELAPGGVILFGSDLRDAEQLRALIEDLQARSDIPLLVAIDHEGGVVDRFARVPAIGATPMPAAAAVGRTGDSDLAYEIGRTMARELRSLGVTVNLAPVADLRTNPENTVIGSRSYGENPELVARMVAATVRGLQDGGVSATLKHFPGHGDSAGDSHRGPVILQHDLERLRGVELAPFVAGIQAGSDLVLTAHIAFPAITGSSTEPATFSRIIMGDLLRTELGFDGVVITDALVMQAVTDLASPEEAALLAIEAGADLLLQPLAPLEVRDSIVAAVSEGRLTTVRLDSSVRRILRLKFRRGLLEPRELPLPTRTVASEGAQTTGDSDQDHFGDIVRIPERFTIPGAKLETVLSRALVDRVRAEGGE